MIAVLVGVVAVAGVLTQDVRVDTALTAHQAVLGETAEHTWAGDARVREVYLGSGDTSGGQ